MQQETTSLDSVFDLIRRATIKFDEDLNANIFHELKKHGIYIPEPKEPQPNLIPDEYTNPEIFMANLENEIGYFNDELNLPRNMGVFQRHPSNINYTGDTEAQIFQIGIMEEAPEKNLNSTLWSEIDIILLENGEVQIDFRGRWCNTFLITIPPETFQIPNNSELYCRLTYFIFRGKEMIGDDLFAPAEKWEGIFNRLIEKLNKPKKSYYKPTGNPKGRPKKTK